MDIPVLRYDTEDPATRRANLEHALKDIGFMSIRGIGIPEEVINDLFQLSARFFSGTAEAKATLAYGQAEDNFGYQAPGMEALDPNSPPDLKETLTVRNPPAQLSAPWPDSAFRDTLLRFYQCCAEAAAKLQTDIAELLQLPPGFFTERITGENITLRLLHYPPLAPESADQLGAGAHTDYGMLTFLFQDNTGGLEVFDRDRDTWRPVKPEPGSIVVNTGDMMEHWTNGRFRSTRHRVKPRSSGQSRYSIALFLDPDDEVEVACLPSCVSHDNPARYPATTAKEHLLNKLRASHTSS